MLENNDGAEDSLCYNHQQLLDTLYHFCARQSKVEIH